MPISITRTYSQASTRTYSRARHCSRGFTLLEILVVISIVAILTATVILGFTGADAEQDLKGSAQRMAVRVELARQRSLQRNREWGIFVREDAYTFVEYDPESQAWIEQAGRPFEQSDVPEFVELRLQTEGVGELPFSDAEDTPQIIVFSSGEITPFTIFLLPDWDSFPWLVSSDGISRTAAERRSDATASARRQIILHW